MEHLAGNTASACAPSKINTAPSAAKAPNKEGCCMGPDGVAARRRAASPWNKACSLGPPAAALSLAVGTDSTRCLGGVDKGSLSSAGPRGPRGPSTGPALLMTHPQAGPGQSTRLSQNSSELPSVWTGTAALARASSRLPSPPPQRGSRAWTACSWVDAISVTAAQRGQGRACGGRGFWGRGEGMPALKAPGGAADLLGGSLARVSCVPPQDDLEGSSRGRTSPLSSPGLQSGSLLLWPVCP